MLQDDEMAIGGRAIGYQELVETVEDISISGIRDIDFYELSLLAGESEKSFLPVDLKRTLMYGMGVLDIRSSGFILALCEGAVACPLFVAAFIPTKKPGEVILAGVGNAAADKAMTKRGKIDVGLAGVEMILESPYNVFHCHAHESNHTARNLWAYLAKKTGKFTVSESPSDEAPNFIRITLERI